MALQVGAMQEVPQNGESEGKRLGFFCIVLPVFNTKAAACISKPKISDCLPPLYMNSLIIFTV